MTHTLLLAQAPGEPSLLVGLMPMILIFAVFYFIWFMPMRKKQKALEALIQQLKKGDKVVTTGGIYGEVVKTQDHVVVLKLADNVKVRVAKRAIAGLEGSPEDAQAPR